MTNQARAPKIYKRDFWQEENLKFSKPHFRLEKAARLINKLSAGREVDLLDVGCGPAALQPLVAPNVHYHGIDIAIQEPAPNLIEADLLASPIRFGDQTFDLVLAQGVFEYLGEHQAEKFAEIAPLLKDRDSTFVVSYVNFDHRDREIYFPYSNIQPFASFRADLARHFTIRRVFATSHNWHHHEPVKEPVRTLNMHLNVNVPVISSKLAVEYFMLCSPR
jgi:cyclopropane fatty-acyl-phospholipid synthase-like methyltransferase